MGSYLPGDKTQWEFGIDVFLEQPGTYEAFCVETSSSEYIATEKLKPWKFVMDCKDNGDGTFTVLDSPVPMVSTPIPSEICHPTPPPPTPTPTPPPPKSDLDWYMCVKDPGCVNYTMSPQNVSFSEDPPKSGDSVTVTVTGKTTIKTVTEIMSYRIYELTGHNGAAGNLIDVLTVTSDGDFTMKIPFQLTSDYFNTTGSKNWFEFGIDVFQKSEGSDEAMCIEVANSQYTAYMESKAGFTWDCKDNGDGTYTPQPD